MKRSAGFTIIEVVLFLAISGLMITALLVGTSIAIQQQQYRDAVQSFASFLRGQYEQVVSVENDRSATNRCVIGGADAVATNRGQSNCMVIGRYIRTEGATDNTYGDKYSAYPVYAARVAGVWRYAVGASERVRYEMNWGARTRFANQNENGAHIAILIYRDPEVGNIVVRANSGRYGTGAGSDGVHQIEKFFQGITETGLADQFVGREICVYDRGWMTGQRQSVYLGDRAGSGDAVTVSPATGGCNDR